MVLPTKSLLLLLRVTSTGVKASKLKAVPSEGLGEGNVNSLLKSPQGASKVLELLAVAGDIEADHLEGNNAVVAVRAAGHGVKDGGLLNVGGDEYIVDAGVENEVVHVNGTNLLAVQHVSKGGVALQTTRLVNELKREGLGRFRKALERAYNFNSKDRGVGDVDGAVEVVGLGGNVDVGIGDLEAVEAVEALELDSLLEGDAVLLGDALDLDVGITLNGHPEGFVGKQPGVEGSEGLHVGDLDNLAHVDDLESIRSSLGELDAGERGVRLEILEVHDTGEGGDGGMSLAVGADGGVDSHVVFRRPGVRDDDGVNGKLGLVELLLGDLGHANKDATRSALIKQEVHLKSIVPERTIGTLT